MNVGRICNRMSILIEKSGAGYTVTFEDGMLILPKITSEVEALTEFVNKTEGGGERLKKALVKEMRNQKYFSYDVLHEFGIDRYAVRAYTNGGRTPYFLGIGDTEAEAMLQAFDIILHKE